MCRCVHIYTRERDGLCVCKRALLDVHARSLVEYSNDGRTYSFCTFNIARVSVEVFTAVDA